MLVGLLNSVRTNAWDAEKGPMYFCPNCNAEVVLKKGRRLIHHFSHKPPHYCDWSSGETRDHMQAKQMIAQAFEKQGISTEVEAPVLSLGGDRRADVLLTNRSGKRAAIEIQHSPLDEETIERRTQAYIDADVPVAWLGLFSKKMKDDLEKTTNGGLIRQFSPRPWQKWAHAYGFKSLWFVDPTDEVFWSATLEPYMIDVEASSWYDEYGEEQSTGGYSRFSKRWRSLVLTGPFDPSVVKLSTHSRKAWSGGTMRLPAGRFLKLNGPV